MAVNPIQLQKSLKGIAYPASKARLVQHAQQHGADENILSALKDLPDEKFHGPNAVSQAVSKTR